MKSNFVLKRRPGRWRQDLIDYLHQVARRPHSFGEHDCALLASGCIEAMTGVDLGGEFRGTYASARAGLKKLREKGYADHVAFVAEHFEELVTENGEPWPAIARAGDIAVIEQEGEIPNLGIVQGSMIYVLRINGLGFLPLLSASRAFRVP